MGIGRDEHALRGRLRFALRVRHRRKRLRGRALHPAAARSGHLVRALVRRGSENKIPTGAHAVLGDALDAASYVDQIAPARTLVHLVGTPHPNPLKAREFREVDLVSIREAVQAATRAGVRHIVYMSVAQPAPVMREYVAARQHGEAIVRSSRIAATLLRPWYVVGPGHRWPYVLKPLYALLERLPATRDAALRLGLVTQREMLCALVDAVEHPPGEVRIVAVPEIRASCEAQGQS